VPRRRANVLLPLEDAILEIALERAAGGEATFHGFAVAQELEAGRAQGLVGHGTLYKALARLEGQGLLESSWEADAPEGRPRRRLYRATATTQDALRRSRRLLAEEGRTWVPARPGVAGS
jgi:DNA-binding PadR family transcriptional regulator